MLDAVKEFISPSPGMAWSIVGVLVAMLVIASLWEKVKWWAFNTWVNFPFLGRIATLSRDLNRDTLDNAWFKAEKTLCREYKSFIRVQDEHDFREKVDYLTKAGDNGRKPTPKWIWFLTVSMVFVEAMGFSYVLAGYTLPGASENLQQTGAYGIAFLISTILVAFTHFAGHELHQSTQIKHARREWVEDRRRRQELNQPEVQFVCDPMPIAKPQSTDNGQPTYKQLANRVGTHDSYKITWLTVLIVVIIAVLATYVRGQVLERTLTEVVVGKSEQTVTAPGATDGLNMTAKPSVNSILPDADVAQNQAAKDKVVQDETNIDRKGGWGTFIALAIVFVFLQILGVIFGYRWGFAGKDSAAAYRSIGSGRYTTYGDVREHFKEIADTAQAKLENLQQKLMDRNARIGSSNIHTSKSFYDFMESCRLDDARDQASQRAYAAQNAAANAPTVAKPKNILQQNHGVPATSVDGKHVPIPALSVDQAVCEMDAIQNKEAKKEYFHGLPTDMQASVLNAIKVAKEAERNLATRAQLDAELDDVL